MKQSKSSNTFGYVYILKEPKSGLYKIGRSKNPFKRLSSLNTAAPYKLTLEHLIECDDYIKEEQFLHSILKNNKVRAEWFRLSDDVFSWLKSIPNNPCDFLRNNF